MIADIVGQVSQSRIADWIGVVAALLLLATFAMKTMVRLRVVALASSAVFVLYGLLSPSYLILALQAVLLPLNAWRLRQMLFLVREVEATTSGELDMNWIKPFTTTRDTVPGEVLFRKGDEAKEIIFVMSGSLRLPEIGVAIPPGEVIGELGMLSPDKMRTQSAVCTDAGQLLVITYDQVRELFFQNPKFGYFFMQLSARRLFENLKRMQIELDALRPRNVEP